MSLRHYLFIAAVAALVTLLITPLVRRFALDRGLVDYPGGRKIHSKPIPRLGGVAIFAGVVAAITVQVVGEYFFSWNGTIVDGSASGWKNWMPSLGH